MAFYDKRPLTVISHLAQKYRNVVSHLLYLCKRAKKTNSLKSETMPLRSLHDVVCFAILNLLVEM